MKIKYSLAAFLALTLLNAEEISLGSVSVTATKVETATKDISQSIAVVDEQEVEDKNILNIQEAIETIAGVNAESSTNSPNPRLIIRGAGLKARYGVREIMVMKDGVPMTDPDSFTRFDFIDMQDVESLEVQKGPGSINAVNTTGGVIQLVTKSVFKKAKNRIKLGLGNDGQKNANLKVRGKLGENDFVSTTLSHRSIDNAWRKNNEFSSTQFTQKHGHIFKDDSTVETEFSYTESNMNIPASMNDTEFKTFKETGEQKDTVWQWQHSARDSKIYSLNSKYEKEVGDLTLKPRIYFNTWEHFHPVSGMINDSTDNSTFGTDLEFDYNHKAFGKKAILVAGITAKADVSNGSEKYQYKDITTTSVDPDGPFGPSGFVDEIVTTLSKEKGVLASTEDAKTTLYGVYLMERFSVSDKLKFDFSTRVDRLKFDVSGDENTTYDYGSKSYIDGVGIYSFSKSYNLGSVKLGSVYKLNDSTNTYASIAAANQAPTSSEYTSNLLDGKVELESSTTLNYEIGLKARTKKYAYDMAVYQTHVTNEIVKSFDADLDSSYSNAGETLKRGFEFQGTYKVSEPLKVGASYAYNNFKFVKFEEITSYNPKTNTSREGNYLPYIPQNQYSLFAALKTAGGFKARVTTKTWGSYYMDNANSKKYEGYDLITDLMIGYETKKKEHSIQLNIRNITNEYYAMNASANTDGDETYQAAAPLQAMLTYKYQF